MAHKTKNGNGKKAQGFTFTAPAASSVQLVGDFTEWKEHPIGGVRTPILKRAVPW